MTLVRGQINVHEEIVNIGNQTFDNFLHFRIVDGVNVRHTDFYPPDTIIYGISGLVISDCVDHNGTNPKIWFGSQESNFNHFSGSAGFGGSGGAGLPRGTFLEGACVAPIGMGRRPSGIANDGLVYRVTDGETFSRGTIVFFIHYYAPVNI